MKKDHLVWLVIGVLVFYAYARYRGAIAGPPWSPSSAMPRAQANT